MRRWRVTLEKTDYEDVVVDAESEEEAAEIAADQYPNRIQVDVEEVQ